MTGKMKEAVSRWETARRAEEAAFRKSAEYPSPENVEAVRKAIAEVEEASLAVHECWRDNFEGVACPLP
jgi:hypothetical protein